MTGVWAWDALDSEERVALRCSVGAVADELWGPLERADRPTEVVARLRDRLGALDVPLLLTPESEGGVGGDLADVAALAAEIGRRLLPFSAAELVGTTDPQVRAMLDLFEMAGALGGLVGATRRYLSQRVQFGRPLLEFQVLQHRLADVSVRQHLIETAALGGLRWLASPEADGAVDPRAVLALLCSTYQDAVEEALQLHGAIGFTWEAGFHRYLDHAMRIAAGAA
ncbi:MAG: bbsG 1 [Frankiales bacterium]|nr:bbsG 1 [Frankiales bacterium]